ncbi:MAG: methyltransferase domain-containing protein [Bryobacteraceae bacterium]
MPAESSPDRDGAMTEELTAVIQEIRDRVRARYPEGTAGAGAVLPDLLPILHERDAAEAKVAAIGTVNPRPGGALNSLIQSVKKLVARLLDWHVRDQVEFNRALVRSLGAVLDALNENNRALSALGARDEALLKSLDETRQALEALGAGHEAMVSRLEAVGARLEELLEVRDIRSHWAQWRVEWERKLDQLERHFFRNVAELNGAFQHRATMLESNLNETTRLQHSDFLAALWKGIRETRTELERLIHAELRLVRQRAVLPQLAPPAAATSRTPAAGPPIDWLHFAARFRGSEEYVRERQRFYLPHFKGCRQVLDLGCGRGEFLELLQEEEIPVRGIDLSAECVALCRAKGLDAEVADLFSYLDALTDGALDGIFCAQVIEHLPPASLPEMLRLAAAKLAPGGLLAVETPNPECLAILTSHFYLDPTHHHPIPPLLLSFYLEESGMGELEIHRFAPAAESMPALNLLPAEFREAFFGALDYAVLGRRL